MTQVPAAVVTWLNRDVGAPGNSHSRKTFVQDMQIIRLLPGVLPWSGSLRMTRPRQTLLEGSDLRVSTLGTRLCRFRACLYARGQRSFFKITTCR